MACLKTGKKKKKSDKTKPSLAQQNCICHPHKCITRFSDVRGMLESGIWYYLQLDQSCVIFQGLVLVSSCGYVMAASRFLCFYETDFFSSNE